MKRRFTTALVILLAFALLIGTTAITASAETTTYTPIGGSAAFIKNLVVDSDANIPSRTLLLIQTPISPASHSNILQEEALLRTQPLRPLRSLRLQQAEKSVMLCFQMTTQQAQSPAFRQTTGHTRHRAKSTLKKVLR